MGPLSYEASIVMIVLLAIISFAFLQWSIFYIGNREVSLAFMSRFLIRRRGIFRLMPRRTSLFFFGRYPAPFRRLFSLLVRHRHGRRAPARSHLYV